VEGMRRRRGAGPVLFLGLGCLLGAALTVEGQTPDTAAVPDAERLTLELGARVQVRYTHPLDDDGRRVEVRRARLSLKGKAYRHFDYLIQAGLEGGSARLLDGQLTFQPTPLLGLWVGQGKAPFGRQQITSSGALQFVDRSIVDGRFSAGRQQGATLFGRPADGRLEYAVGIYNGHGINRSENPNDRFMSVARLVATPLGPLPPAEGALARPQTPRLAIGLAGLRNTEGEGADEFRIRRLNGEAAFALHGLSLVGELYREWAEDSAGAEERTDGVYLQGGLLIPGHDHEVVARWALIRPDLPGRTGRTETGVGYSYYLDGHRAKLQADLRRIRDRLLDSRHDELRVQVQLIL
jgi:phosphate-selective porin OprO and OprP